jgi:hypothetical protein
MRRPHPYLDHNVQPSAILWRYMDFAKFVSMIANRALYFSRADLLGDRMEGSLTQANRVQLEQSLEYLQPETRAQVSEIFGRVSGLRRSMPAWTYVNCWHIGAHESMALWQGYGGAYGVAVTTTFELLNTLLPEQVTGLKPRDAYLHVARVRYIDHTSTKEVVPDSLDFLVPLFWKSVTYTHENELRAAFGWIPLITEPPDTDFPAGHFIPVDLQKLVAGVVVSPLAPAWFEGVVRSAFEHYGFSFSVQRSLMSVDPEF